MKIQIIGIIMLLLLSACSTTQVPTGSAVSNGPTKDVYITASNFAFDQNQVTINKGDHVVVHITSTEGTHGVMIPGLGLSTGRISPGQEQTLEFNADKEGSFDYFCNVPCGSGHRSMRGQLVVAP